MHTQHANMHTQYINMRYARATCRYAAQHGICSMHARSACARQPPGTAQRSKFMDINHKGFSIHHATEKDSEVVEKPSPLGNKCKGQMGEPLPTCMPGPWGTLHQVSRLYTQVPNNRLGIVMPIVLISCFLLNFSRSHCISIAAWLAQPGATVPVVGLAYPDGQCLRKTYEGAGTNIIQLTQSQGTPHHEKPRVLLPAHAYVYKC